MRGRGSDHDHDSSDSNTAMKWVAGLVSTVVVAIIIGLLGWIASSVLTTHDQLLTLQSQVANFPGFADRLDKLDRRLSEVEYWQRWHGSSAPAP